MLQRVLSLPLSMTQPTRLLPPGSGGEVRRQPTQQRAGSRGRRPAGRPSDAGEEHEWGLGCREEEKKGGGHTPPLSVLLPQKPCRRPPAAARTPAPSLVLVVMSSVAARVRWA